MSEDDRAKKKNRNKEPRSTTVFGWGLVLTTTTRQGDARRRAGGNGQIDAEGVDTRAEKGR